VSKYDFNNPGWTSGSGLFTQMVWRSTKAVGCAVNLSCSWAMYVCHYSPPGNMVGASIDWSQQVRPAIMTAAVPKPLSDGLAVVDAAWLEDHAWDARDAQPDGDDDVPTGGQYKQTVHSNSTLGSSNTAKQQYSTIHVLHCQTTVQHNAWKYHTPHDASNSWECHGSTVVGSGSSSSA
jgi:hypothetical protein